MEISRFVQTVVHKMKVLEMHGNYFRVPNDIKSAQEAMERPAQQVILEQLEGKEVMERALA